MDDLIKKLKDVKANMLDHMPHWTSSAAVIQEAIAVLSQGQPAKPESLAQEFRRHFYGMTDFVAMTNKATLAHIELALDIVQRRMDAPAVKPDQPED